MKRVRQLVYGVADNLLEVRAPDCVENAMIYYTECVVSNLKFMRSSICNARIFRPHSRTQYMLLASYPNKTTCLPSQGLLPARRLSNIVHRFLSRSTVLIPRMQLHSSVPQLLAAILLFPVRLFFGSVQHHDLHMTMRTSRNSASMFMLSEDFLTAIVKVL